MSDYISYLTNVFGVDLLPFTVPLLVYLVYRSWRTKCILKGKVVLITGANSGLGEALAHVFYRAGCKLILAARRIDELERVKSDLLKGAKSNKTFEPVVLHLDLVKLETLQEKANEALSIYNQIDILINNAGISFRGNILDTSLDVHRNVMTVNYFGPVAFTKALLPSLIKSKGHVVAVSSIQGRIALPSRSAYAASKHALQAYMDCLRSEEPDIKVTVAHPGYIRTNLSLNAVTGSGERYGDDATSKGYSPEYVAEKIYKAVITEEKELAIAPLLPRIIVIIRTLLPSLYFYLIKLWGNLGKKKS